MWCHTSNLKPTTIKLRVVNVTTLRTNLVEAQAEIYWKKHHWLIKRHAVFSPIREVAFLEAS